MLEGVRWFEEVECSVDTDALLNETFSMKTSCFSNRIVRIVFLTAFIFLSLNSLEANRQKLPITHEKVTGSILDLIRSNENLQEENERLKARETSKWLVINQTQQVLKLSLGSGEQDLVLNAYASVETSLESEKKFKPGDSVSVRLADSSAKQVDLKPGKTIKLGNGFLARVDFLNGSGAWMVLVLAE